MNVWMNRGEETAFPCIGILDKRYRKNDENRKKMWLGKCHSNN